MKIHFDKINTPPWYPFTPAEMRLVFASIPQEWLADVRDVRMSGSLDLHARTMLVPSEKRLIVYSRDRSQREVVDSTLAELAAYFLGYKPHGGLGEIGNEQLHHIRGLTEPLVETILAALPRPKPNPLHPAPLRAPWENRTRRGTLGKEK